MQNRKLIIITASAAAIMFGFCFAMVPLYNVFCKATGVSTSSANGALLSQATPAQLKEQPDLSREITVQFTATNHNGMPWAFYPKVKSITVHPGESHQVLFYAKNTTPQKMTVQAIPSMTPTEAISHFHKIQCFCFNQQSLSAGESKDMPMQFRIDKAIPKDVHVITLAYTLFDVTPTPSQKGSLSMTDQQTKTYYIAKPSYWPLMGAGGLFANVFGLVQCLHGNVIFGAFFILIGVGLLIATLFGWFGAVIHESLAGLHSRQMDRSYRFGMLWFIVSEIALFGVFFLCLFYARVFGITELGGEPFAFAKAIMFTKGGATHHYLWPNFHATWPLLVNPNNTLYQGATAVIPPWRIPALNTLILLTSAATLTWAHWGLLKERRRQLLIGLSLTILLGVTFEALQIHEYIVAYTELNLTLKSGIYGSIFFMITGLHAVHVTLGAIMLSVIFIRCLKGHFLPAHHFGFEAVAWYWHFVDVVWLFLFVFVYWL